jgi:hypothetical protein
VTPESSQVRSRAAFALIGVLVGIYYLWAVRSAGYPFAWNNEQPGYYNYLARGFAAGHLYLPIEPSPQLLAQPDPWDPKVDGSLKLFDTVLFDRHYYLYHGAGPAIMLFAPYRILTHRDLPENFALFLFCFGGFLFSAGTLLTLLDRTGIRFGIPLLSCMLLALGLCQSVPFLLSRVWVYEVAIGGGYFCLSAAVFFLARSFHSGRVQWLAASGLMFGMSIACRPHLFIVGVLALALVAVTSSRTRLAGLALPLIMVGVSIAAYNFARFGNPAEFGNRWMLSGENMGQIKLSLVNAVPGMYYLLVASPKFSPVFPWVELRWPVADFPRPTQYYVEQTVGALYLAPFVIGFPLVFFARRNRSLLALLLVAAAGILLIVTMTGWSAQRYEVDFLPLPILATLAAFAEVVCPARRAWRFGFGALLASLIAFGSIVNLAMGISGPYWEMIKNKPLRFVRIAGWFSPVERFRPALNPPIDIRFSAVVEPRPDHIRQELLTAARFPFNYELYVEHVAGRPKLISSYAGSVETGDLGGDGQPGTFRVAYLPGSGEFLVKQNGSPILRHKIGPFVTAPSQIVVDARPEVR